MQDLELHEMQVHRVSIVRRVDEAPFFKGVQFHDLRNRVIISLLIDAYAEGTSMVIRALGEYEISGHNGLRFLEPGEGNRLRQAEGRPGVLTRKHHAELHEVVNLRVI